MATNRGQGSFGVRRAEDVLQYLKNTCRKPLAETSFMEIGCADGYLLHRLQEMGAKEVMGCEPGPMALEGQKKFGIPMMNDFYAPELFTQKFDVIFSYGLLEHIQNPLPFVRSMLKNVGDQGVIFMGVPNCEPKLQMGDINFLGHQHENYFTAGSIANLLRRAGLSEVNTAIGQNGAMIYAWGRKTGYNELLTEYSDEKLFYAFCAKVQKALAGLQRRVDALQQQGKTWGLYGGGQYLVGVLQHSLQPRFFNGDVARHGMYYPGYTNLIEPPQNLQTNPVDELWIVPVDYDEEIQKFIEKESLFSDKATLFSLKQFLLSLEGQDKNKMMNNGLVNNRLNKKENEMGGRGGVELDLFSLINKEQNNEEQNVERVGEEMYEFMKLLYPLCRSITGNGVRETLQLIQEKILLKIVEVPSGTAVFDWVVPKEWNITEAYVANSRGERVIDFKTSNLQVLNYSIPVREKVNLAELKQHLFTLPEYPDWIPYLTSYYKEAWGFCITQKQFDAFPEDEYEVVINSSLTEGSMTYGELYIPGQTEEEVLLSTYICHPSMCNDNLSGVVLTTFLAKMLLRAKLHYSYRFLFIPETIGAITWLSENKEKAKNIKHGLVLTCVGDQGNMTYKRSREGGAIIDKVVEKILSDAGKPHLILDFWPSGSDERQYCSPGFDLPVGSLMRTPYGKYPEYHTSADNLYFVQPQFLAESFQRYGEVLFTLEKNKIFQSTSPYGEPQLGKRGLYSLLGSQKSSQKNKDVNKMALLWVLNLCDGKHSLLDIATRSGMTFMQIAWAVEVLVDHQLLREVNYNSSCD